LDEQPAIKATVSPAASRATVISVRRPIFTKGKFIKSIEFT